MPVLNIKNEKAHQLASELAKITGQSLTDTVLQSLQERLERQKALSRRKGLSKRLLAIAAEMSTLPVLDSRTPDEILGYNDQGHFD